MTRRTDRVAARRAYTVLIEPVLLDLARHCRCGRRKADPYRHALHCPYRTRQETDDAVA